MPDFASKNTHDSEPGYITVIYVSSFGKEVLNEISGCYNESNGTNEGFYASVVNNIYTDKIEDLSSADKVVINQSEVVLVVSEKATEGGISIGNRNSCTITEIFANNLIESGSTNAQIKVDGTNNAFISLRLIINHMIGAGVMRVEFDDLKELLSAGKYRLLVRELSPDDGEMGRNFFRSELTSFEKMLIGIYGGESLTLKGAADIAEGFYDLGIPYLYNIFRVEENRDGWIKVSILGKVP